MDFSLHKQGKRRKYMDSYMRGTLMLMLLIGNTSYSASGVFLLGGKSYFHLGA